MGRKKKEEGEPVKEEKGPAWVPTSYFTKETKKLTIEERYAEKIKEDCFPTIECSLLWLRTQSDKLSEKENIALAEKYYNTKLHFFKLLETEKDEDKGKKKKS